MNLLILTSIILSVILGVGRMVDLALFTDAETGLCVVGSVWLRYAALAVAILLAVAAGRAAKPEARKLCSPCKPSGVMAILGAVWIRVGRHLLQRWFCRTAAPLGKRHHGVRWRSAAVGGCCTLGRELAAAKTGSGPADSLTEVVLGTCPLLLVCAGTLYGEQLQLAPGGPHGGGLADAGRAGLPLGAGAGAFPAGHGGQPDALRQRPDGLGALPVLGASPAAGYFAAGRCTGPAAGLFLWTGAVLHRCAGGDLRGAHYPDRVGTEECSALRWVKC